MPGRDGKGPGGRIPSRAGSGANGQGRGQGRGRGFGGPDVCRCPACGKEVPHVRGQPCNQRKCPECGAGMVRGDSPR